MKRYPPSHRLRPQIEMLESRLAPAVFPPVVDLETLPVTDSFTVNGLTDGGRFAEYVAGVGDINDDGVDDFAIGAIGPGGDDHGKVYIIFGRGSPAFPAIFDVTALDGTNGFVVNGPAGEFAHSARVDAAGDVNGDGIDDMIIGAPGGDQAPGLEAGKAFVIFGSSSVFAAALDVDNLAGANGFTIDGSIHGHRVGSSVAGAGDVNGDGIGDVIVGDPEGAGSAYVVFGQTTPFASNLSVNSLDGTNGFAMLGAASDDHAGDTVSSAGDINGDGFDDVLVGAYGVGNLSRGAAYVVFGRSTPFAATLGLGTLDGGNGFSMEGLQDYGELGRGGPVGDKNVDGVGDVNSDGTDDFIVAASKADGDGLRAGEAYLIFGKTSGFTPSFDLNSLTGSNGFTIHGKGGMLGASVGSGDFDNDGLNDIIVGAPFGEDDAFVIFGKTTAYSPVIVVDTLNGSNGFKIEGMGGSFGRSVGSAGDINNDGVADILIGAPWAVVNGDATGQAYVIFGKNAAPTATPPVLVDVTQSGAKSYRFTVTFADPDGIKVSSLKTGNIVVMGPDGFNQVAEFVKVNNKLDGTPRKATYQITPPNNGSATAFWDFRDNGTYSVELVGNQIKDRTGKAIKAKTLGTFEVNIAKEIIAVGKNSRGGAVQVFSADGSLMYTINDPFGASFTGGVRVAVGDVNGDGTPDVVAAMGPDSVLTTEIHIFDGQDGDVITDSIQPHGSAYTGGAYVAVADFVGTNPGVELVVGPGTGANVNPVLVLGLDEFIHDSFIPYDVSYSGGVRVAVGEIDGTRAGLELVTVKDAAGEVTKIRAWDNALATQIWEAMPNAKFGGAFIAIGNVDGDGENEVVVGAEGKNKPFVRILDGDTGTLETSFLAYDKTFRGGVRVGLLDVNDDGKQDILVATKTGRLAKIFNPATKKQIDSFNAFEAVFKGGLFIAGG